MLKPCGPEDDRFVYVVTAAGVAARLRPLPAAGSRARSIFEPVVKALVERRASGGKPPKTRKLSVLMLPDPLAAPRLTLAQRASLEDQREDPEGFRRYTGGVFRLMGVSRQ